MRTRTRLTTPPGEEPASDESVRVRDPERYSPAIGIPREPDVPGRYRRLLLTLSVLMLLGVIGYVLFQLANAGQFQDPSLDEDPGMEEPAATQPPAAPTAEPSLPES